MRTAASGTSFVGHNDPDKKPPMKYWIQHSLIGFALALPSFFRPMLGAEVAPPPALENTNSTPQFFASGFVVRELPVGLSNQNNVEYAPDGRLFTAGYDGRM